MRVGSRKFQMNERMFACEVHLVLRLVSANLFQETDTVRSQCNHLITGDV